MSLKEDSKAETLTEEKLSLFTRSQGIAADSKKLAPTEEERSTTTTNQGAANPEDAKAVPIDFLNDDPSQMTLSRRLALKLMKYRWYYKPKVIEGESEHVGNSSEFGEIEGPIRHTDAYPYTHSRRETPSLEKAWAYFEHVALPRFIVESNEKGIARKNILIRCFRKLCCRGNEQLQPAKPGEKDRPTKLYDPVFTPHKQLGDFGLGTGLYFSTLRAWMVITILAGILNIPNLIYFSSSEYSNGQTDLEPLLKGSAICTNTQWVPCPHCRNHSYLPDTRLGVTTNKNTELLFALQNDCDGARLQQGMISYATVWLLVIGLIIMNVYVRRMEVGMDEDEQTAQDYSIVIDNPPLDATDPSEWKQFFDGTFGTHVTACTVAVENHLLIQSLVERRQLLRRIHLMIEPGTAMDRLTLSEIATKEEHERGVIRRLASKLFVPGLPELYARLQALSSYIQSLAQQDYHATTIFVTFETEADQRRVLEAFKCTSVLDRWRNNQKAAKEQSHLFRGSLLLSVYEPTEPSAIRWQDLHATTRSRIAQQILTFLVMATVIALNALVIKVCSEKSVVFSAFAISISNLQIPEFAKWLNSFEKHGSRGGVQRSLYLKIALFRWVNTAIVILIIMPFTSALANGGGLIEQIQAIFIAEIITANAFQLLDPVAHIRRHILAPRAVTQDAMNLHCRGTPFELAERYTNMTTTILLALWYSAIYPGAWFMSAFALFVNYFVDRFSLRRTWKRQSRHGKSISQVSRYCFFLVSLVAMAVVSSYFWSAFPFDNLCVTNTTVSSTYVGSWTITPLDKMSMSNSVGDDIIAEVSKGDANFQYCLQDFLRYPIGQHHFPFIPDFQPPGLEWMTDEQDTVTRIYGWSALAMCFLVFKTFGILSTLVWLICFLKQRYIPKGEDQGVNFSDVPSISAYVPQVHTSVFSYPLVACNIDGVDGRLLDWNDPDQPFEFYDLTKDAEVLTWGTEVPSKATAFSRICHWPPPHKKNETAAEK